MPKSTKEFVRDGRNMFGNRFDYSESIYTAAREPVKVTCRKHGSFVVEARNHLRSESDGVSIMFAGGCWISV